MHGTDLFQHDVMQSEARDARLFLPQHLVARCLGISVQAFQKLGIPPHTTVGRETLYFLPDVVQSRLRQIEERHGGLDAERAKEVRLRTEMRALDLAQRRGELIHVDVASATWAAMVTACRSALLQMPTRVAPAVARARSQTVVARILDEAVTDSLRRLSDPSDQGPLSQAVRLAVQELFATQPPTAGEGPGADGQPASPP